MKEPIVTVTKVIKTGEENTTYDMTPAEFVEEVREAGGYCMSAGICEECPFLSERLISHAEIAHAEDEYVKYNRMMECIKSAVVHFDRQRWVDQHEGVPDYIGCQWYYQRHAYENKFLHALAHAELIRFFDVTELPTMREKGYLFNNFDLINL